jgi:MoaA/NifB/PqqE/SkfB family radical SAM enzyme
VAWAITSACNRSCGYCRRLRHGGAELSTRQAEEVIDTLARLGCARVSFTGGEPLLRNDMGALLDRARARGIATRLNSNGALVRERIDGLSGLDALTLSLDGPEPVHDAIRGRGSYREVVDAARAARERGIAVAFTCVLSSSNPGSERFVLDVARGLGSSVLFQPAAPQVRGEPAANPMIPGASLLAESVRFLVERKRAGDPTVGNSFAGLRHMAHFPGPRPMRCASGFVSCRIEPGGEVVYCGLPRPGFVPLSVLDGLERAFRGLAPITCGDCWCAGRVELNSAFALRPSAIANQLGR